MAHLVWFRRDLRTHDNPALEAAFEQSCQDHHGVIGVFFITAKQWRKHHMAYAQQDLIYRTLSAFSHDLHQISIPLVIESHETFKQTPDELIRLCKTLGITNVYANKEYEINEIKRDQRCTQMLESIGVGFKRFDDQCIVNPGSVLTKQEQMYQIFTPFYRRWQEILEISGVDESSYTPDASHITTPSYHLPENITKLLAEQKSHLDIINKQHQNMPKSALPADLESAYPAGESAGKDRLKRFIDNTAACYDQSRDSPTKNTTSQLSAYLTVGSLSVMRCYQHACFAQKSHDADTGAWKSIQTWKSELAWRDFYRHILVAHPRVCRHEAFNVDMDKRVSWSYDSESLTAWQQGHTGFPIVDAAMRCLNQTGFMHNRLRMITAMFLTKDLLIDWRLGERYFMEQLIDGDFASNNGGWQWSASVGTDAAPYFRIMNPFSQAKSHDPDAVFIKRWIPELDQVEPSAIHHPKKLAKIAKSLGYPAPMVDHKQARLRAIEMFKK